MAKKPLADDVKVEELAKSTDKYSGADLGALVNEVVMLAIREYVQSGQCKIEGETCDYMVEKKHFDEALKLVQTTASDIPLQEVCQSEISP